MTDYDGDMEGPRIPEFRTVPSGSGLIMAMRKAGLERLPLKQAAEAMLSADDGPLTLTVTFVVTADLLEPIARAMAALAEDVKKNELEVGRQMSGPGAPS